jgi:hypothetical protein
MKQTGLDTPLIPMPPPPPSAMPVREKSQPTREERRLSRIDESIDNIYFEFEKLEARIKKTTYAQLAFLIAFAIIFWGWR